MYNCFPTDTKVVVYNVFAKNMIVIHSIGCANNVFAKNDDSHSIGHKGSGLSFLLQKNMIVIVLDTKVVDYNFCCKKT